MGYSVFNVREKYQARKGLEGPFYYPNGRVLYYDPKAGQYWDPKTDFYVPNDEVSELKAEVFNILSR
jgi:hypothetical protein